jgi:hypothetical protein
MARNNSRHEPLDHSKVDADLAAEKMAHRRRPSLLGRIFSKVTMILVIAIVVSAGLAVLVWLWRGIIGA